MNLRLLNHCATKHKLQLTRLAEMSGATTGVLKSHRITHFWTRRVPYLDDKVAFLIGHSREK